MSKRCLRQARVDAPFFDAECRHLKCDVRARAQRRGDLTDNHALDLLYHTTVRIRTKRLAQRHAQLRRLCNEVHSDHRAFCKKLRAHSGDVHEQLKRLGLRLG